MKNFLEMPDDQKKNIIKEAVHRSNWEQVKILYKKDLDKEIQKARLDEMNRMLEKLKSGEWKSFATEVTDRIKQLEEGK